VCDPSVAREGKQDVQCWWEEITHATVDEVAALSPLHFMLAHQPCFFIYVLSAPAAHFARNTTSPESVLR
jgi:hypothetical protein